MKINTKLSNWYRLSGSEGILVNVTGVTDHHIIANTYSEDTGECIQTCRKLSINDLIPLKIVPLFSLSNHEYNLITEVGFLWEVYPKATGSWEDDTKLYRSSFEEDQPLQDTIQSDIDQDYIRKNEGKSKLSYMLMFPNAIKAISDRLTENEDKYPNDAFCDYIPEEVVDSQMRHLVDIRSKYPVFSKEETKLAHMTANAFNALCLLESAIHQEHEWAKGGSDNEST